MNTELQLRRARRPYSLASAVIALLDELQCPISTQAVRVILTARGRDVTAEHLSRLAAYQREDFRRTRMPPPLCWAINPGGTAATPRWWARGDWRLLRRIRTDDARQIWFAHLATCLCHQLANNPETANPELVLLAHQAANIALDGGRTFDTPASRDDWLNLRSAVYGPYSGALNNLTGGTGEQYEAEATLLKSDMSGTDLLFGHTPAETRKERRRS